MSSPLPRRLTRYSLSVIVEHGPPRGSLKFMSTGVALAEIEMISVGLVEGIRENEETIKAISEQHKIAMANLDKHHEEALEKYKANTTQNF
ncbi:hypothetical protein J1N35_001991 [Gossypium stocksii]|uniref:Uncharacterized protein n=1 Tax=Gossypium stocksii TaxID=47602 RepID=A0A9D3WKX1_9ROSI|nr:hypothetical protein J1N35_001991 [Gossypium stocksii]